MQKDNLSGETPSIDKSTEVPRRNIVGRFRNYIRDLRLEMRAVTWPTLPQVRATTAVVIIFVLTMAMFFWVLDSLLRKAIAWLLKG